MYQEDQLKPFALKRDLFVLFACTSMRKSEESRQSFLIQTMLFEESRQFLPSRQKPVSRSCTIYCWCLNSSDAHSFWQVPMSCSCNYRCASGHMKRGSRALGKNVARSQLRMPEQFSFLQSWLPTVFLLLAEGPARKQGWQEIICRWMNGLHNLAAVCRCDLC